MEKIREFAADMSASYRRVIERVGWRLLVGLLISICTLVLFGWLTDKVFQGEFAVFDSSVRDGFQRLANPFLTGVMISFTYLGSVYGITALFACALILFYFFRQRRSIALLSITMSGEAILGIVLKLSFQRERPEAFFGFTPPVSYSFPSGHAFASLCFFGVLAWLTTSHINSKYWIAFVWIIAALFILAIGSSRIYLGVHYPSDIVAGYLAGIVWLSAVYLADHKFHNPKRQ